MCSSKANTLQFTEPRAANAVNAMTKDLQSCKNLEESSRWEISAHTELWKTQEQEADTRLIYFLCTIG